MAGPLAMHTARRLGVSSCPAGNARMQAVHRGTTSETRQHWVASCPGGAPAPRRMPCAPVCAKKKGSAGQPGIKVSARGKVSSRPGMVSPKKARDAAEPQQQVQQQEQGEQHLLAASTSAQEPPATQQQQQQQRSAVQPAAMSEVPERQRSIAETPQVVVDRMFKRILICAGTPVVTGLLLFPLFWYLKVVQKVEYPFWLVYVTQAIMFGGGLLGITYGVMSTSWDPRREGSTLGWTEFQANLPILLKKGDR